MLKFVSVKGKTEVCAPAEKGKFQPMHGELSALGMLLCLESVAAGTVEEERSVTEFKGLLVKLITSNFIDFQC